MVRVTINNYIVAKVANLQFPGQWSSFSKYNLSGEFVRSHWKCKARGIWAYSLEVNWRVTTKFKGVELGTMRMLDVMPLSSYRPNPAELFVAYHAQQFCKELVTAFYIISRLHWAVSCPKKGPLLLSNMQLRVANTNLPFLQPSLPYFFFTEAWKGCLFFFPDFSFRFSAFILVEENQKTAEGKVKFLCSSTSLAELINAYFIKHGWMALY